MKRFIISHIYIVLLQLSMQLEPQKLRGNQLPVTYADVCKHLLFLSEDFDSTRRGKWTRCDLYNVVRELYYLP